MVPRRPCLQNVLFPSGVLLSVGVEPEEEVPICASAEIRVL